jgi:hypothetical protein
MTIRLQCQCGAWLRVKDTMAGKIVRCVACQHPVKVEGNPEPTVETSQGSSRPAAELGGSDNPWIDLTSTAPLASDPALADDRSVHRGKTKRNGTAWLWMAFAAGAGGGLVCLVGAVILVLVMRPGAGDRSSPHNGASSTPGPSTQQPGTAGGTDASKGWDDRPNRLDFDPWVPPRSNPPVKVGPAPPRERECINCRGSGTSSLVCTICKGTRNNGAFRCDFCKGQGFAPCSACGGTGRK